MSKSRFDYRSAIEVATEFMTDFARNGESVRVLVVYDGPRKPTVRLESRQKTIDITEWFPNELPKPDALTLRGGFDSWRDYMIGRRGFCGALEDIASAMSKGIDYKEGGK